MGYIIRDRECGIEIEVAETREEAERIIEEYEEEDKAEGNYTPDFYEVVAESRISKVEDKLFELKKTSDEEWVNNALYMLYKYEDTPRMEQALDDIEKIIAEAVI